MKWPRHPLIYEINAWLWLNELGRKLRRSITLATVPENEWDSLAQLGIDGVWLMGVWKRSPLGRTIAMNNPALAEEFRLSLPDVRPGDIVGSPYCVREYSVDERLGGNQGLAIAREKLKRRGLRLMIDFVPNHVAPDHSSVSAHPDYFIRGDAADRQRDPASFLKLHGQIYACGRDPFAPAWTDVLQLNAFHPGVRDAAAETLASIAAQADGVRCDMAMLLLNDVFAKTWGERAGTPPVDEYWAPLIAKTKSQFPDFLFVAEAYWDLESALHQQGFDYCYDKRFYERLRDGNTADVRGHLRADLSCQERLLRFIENHDEPRAASVFSPQKAQAAATILMTSPGAKLLHEGQIEGRKVKLPVFLARRPDEPADADLAAFYRKLIESTAGDAFREGAWRLCECRGWPDNASCQNLIASAWTANEERWLIVVNYSESPAQGMVALPWDDLEEPTWILNDPISGDACERTGAQIHAEGLFVNLLGWAFHLFRFDPHVGACRGRR